MVRQIAIVGAGKMGRGIAQVCAQRGNDVTIVDLEEKILEQAQKTIRSGLDFMSDKGLITEDQVALAISRIRASSNVDEAVAAADFIIEAVPEVLDLKRQLFSQMDRVCGEHTILATNTSSLRISDIAAAAKRPERVVGFHWIFPPYIMPVVEIVAGSRTSEQTLGIAKDVALKLGKTPIVCKDVPGFLINRLQMAIIGEAISLLEQGVATAQDIDNAARMSLGMKLPFWGPLKLEDLSANKRTTLAVFEYLYKETGSDKFRPSDLLREKVKKGELGLDAGRGWHDYSKELPGAVTRERDDMLVKILKFLAESGYANLP